VHNLAATRFPTSGGPTPADPLKQRILDAVDGLHADAAIEDAIERLVFVAKVERGLVQAEAGQLTAHPEIAKRYASKPRFPRHAKAFPGGHDFFPEATEVPRRDAAEPRGLVGGGGEGQGPARLPEVERQVQRGRGALS
jgi:hypothetical protein